MIPFTGLLGLLVSRLIPLILAATFNFFYEFDGSLAFRRVVDDVYKRVNNKESIVDIKKNEHTNELIQPMWVVAGLM